MNHDELARRAAELHRDLEAAWDAAAPADGTVTELSRLLYSAASSAKSAAEALRPLAQAPAPPNLPNAAGPAAPYTITRPWNDGGWT